MPLCLVQSLPGSIHRCTDALTVTIPSQDALPLDAFPSPNRRDVREGRVSLRHHGMAENSDSHVSYDELASICKQWREDGLFSFLEVKLNGPCGADEKAALNKLKQCADWLILDATSHVMEDRGALQIERWEAEAQMMQGIDKKVGLRIRLDQTLPCSVLAPWLSKLCLVLGEPGFVFLESDAAEQTLTLVQKIQDLLGDHLLSKGSARVIPVLHSSLYTMGGRSYELLNFDVLDGLLLESSRPFFGGVVVDQRGEPLFGKSLWAALAAMVCDYRSATSVFAHVPALASFAQKEAHGVFVRKGYDLLLALAAKDQTEALSAKNALESLWAPIADEVILETDQYVAMRDMVKQLLAQAPQPVSARVLLAGGRSQ